MLFESPESPRSLFDQNQDGELPDHTAILRNNDMLNTGIGALSATNMADDEEGYTFGPLRMLHLERPLDSGVFEAPTAEPCL
jgi:hypothetical protein